MRRLPSLIVLVALALATLDPGGAIAAEIRVMISGGVAAAWRELVPQFERTTGHTVVSAFGPSMGSTENAIPVRLARGEPADVLIMVGDALGALVAQDKALAASRVNLARSRIGMVVRAGAPKPDISSPEALKQTLLAAASVAYSDSASGVYVGSELFAKLGITDAMKGKARMIPAEPVAAVVARGDSELGFQQISELVPVRGADLVGPLPDTLQKITVFSAGIARDAREPDAGRALITFIASPTAARVLQNSGLDPVTPPN